MQRTIDIQPIEINGGHYVAISMGGRELRRHGPYADADAAEATVDRLVRHWLTTSPIDVTTSNLVENHDFISDLARYAEGLITEEAVKKKWHFDTATWEALGADDVLVERIEATKTARIRSGSGARERAQVLFATAPTTLGAILNSDSMPARNRIEASKELRQIAVGGPETIPTSEKFSITINLSADEVIRINRPIAAGVDDDGNVIDAAPQGLLAAITAGNKSRGGGDGEPV
jgi:hypothetical protein